MIISPLLAPALTFVLTFTDIIPLKLDIPWAARSSLDAGLDLQSHRLVMVGRKCHTSTDDNLAIAGPSFDVGFDLKTCFVLLHCIQSSFLVAHRRFSKRVSASTSCSYNWPRCDTALDL